MKHRIVLSSKSAQSLSVELLALAEKPSGTAVALSSVSGRAPEDLQGNWALRVEEGRADPPRDYSAEPDGMMWEGTLLHPPRDAESLARAWRAVLAWSPASPRHDSSLWVDFSGGRNTLGPVDPSEAFSVMTGDSTVYMARGFAQVPFRMEYGEAQDWLQVWFEPDFTTLMVHDHHAVTGRHAWDLDNLLLFLRLIHTVAECLECSRVAWTGEGVPVEGVSVPRSEFALSEEVAWRAYADFPNRLLDRLSFKELLSQRGVE